MAPPLTDLRVSEFAPDRRAARRSKTISDALKEKELWEAVMQERYDRIAELKVEALKRGEPLVNQHGLPVTYAAHPISSASTFMHATGAMPQASYVPGPQQPPPPEWPPRPIRNEGTLFDLPPGMMDV